MYSLAHDADAAHYGLQPWERDQFMAHCYPGRQGHQPRALFFHIQDGTTVGSLDWSTHRARNSYSYTIQQDGSILACIPERDAPWTNGAIRNPDAHGKRLIALAGGVNINNFTISVEVEGTPFGAHSEAQMAAAIWLGQDIMRRYPLITIDWVFEHANVDRVQRANCAGPYYREVVRPALAGTRPAPGAGDPDFGTIVRFPQPVRITCLVESLNVRQWAETDAAIVHELTAGATAWAEGYVIGDRVAGEDRWYILSGRGWRVWAGGTDRLALGA